MAKGDCFPAAMKLAKEIVLDDQLDRTEVLIAHGLIVGGGGLVKGIRYWHAWVEMKTSAGWVCLDHSGDRQIHVKRTLWYRAAQCDPRTQVWRYTYDEAFEEILRLMTWGPWVEGWELMGDEHLIEGAMETTIDGPLDL
jgi:hypothetical protein